MGWKGILITELDLEVCEVWAFVPIVVNISLGGFMVVSFRIVMLDDNDVPFSKIGV